MRIKQKQEKMIADELHYCRKKAAEFLGFSVGLLDKIVALTRLGAAKTPIEFYQVTKGSEVWFPVRGLKAFKESLVSNGGAF